MVNDWFLTLQRGNPMRTLRMRTSDRVECVRYKTDAERRNCIPTLEHGNEILLERGYLWLSKLYPDER